MHLSESTCSSYTAFHLTRVNHRFSLVGLQTARKILVRGISIQLDVSAAFCDLRPPDDCPMLSHKRGRFL